MAAAPPASSLEALSEKGAAEETDDLHPFSEKETYGHTKDVEKDVESDIEIKENELKLRQIQKCCQDRDLLELRRLAAEGLSTDEIRKIAWPTLLGSDQCDEVEQDKEKPQAWNELPRHRDEDQVRLDVDRSFIYYPSDESNKQLDRRKAELSDLITEVLRRNRLLCYFQGYHDICQVFLLVLGPEAAVPAVTHLSLSRIRDFMLPSMTPALAHLKLLPLLVSAEDSKLAKHLSLTQPFFALAATLTLYAHEIQEYGDIARLFDAFLAREAVYPVYVFAQIVLLRKEELLKIPADEPEILYSMLCKLPKPLDLDRLLMLSNKLYERFPPKSLPGWRGIPDSSVLKTALDLDELPAQSLEYGKLAFSKQVLDLERAEQRKRVKEVIWKYRKPAGSIGLTVLVGILSWYMRKNGYGVNLLGFGGLLSSLLRKIGR